MQFQGAEKVTVSQRWATVYAVERNALVVRFDDWSVRQVSLATVNRTTMSLAMGLLNLVRRNGSEAVNRHTYRGFAESVDIDRAILAHGAARGADWVSGRNGKGSFECDLENRARYMASLNL